VNALQETSVHCPYCGAQFTALVDVSGGDCDYIEDCAVCCQPIEFALRLDFAGEAELSARRSDDSF
jgi:hypothetical protein